MVPHNKELCEIFNEFFANVVPNLNTPEFTGNFDQSVTVASACPIINSIAKYKNHPSITKVRNKQVSSVTFSFNFVEEKKIEKILRNYTVKNTVKRKLVKNLIFL